MQDLLAKGFDKMSSVSEASSLVRCVAGPRDAADSVKAAIVRAARRLGFTPSRTRSLWYGEARRIDAAEMDKLREHAAHVEKQAAIATMVGLRESLAKTDTDFHRPTIVALDSALRALGAGVCAVAVQEDRD